MAVVERAAGAADEDEPLALEHDPVDEVDRASRRGPALDARGDDLAQRLADAPDAREGPIALRAGLPQRVDLGLDRLVQEAVFSQPIDGLGG